MPQFRIITIALASSGFLFAMSGLHSLAMVLFPLPVALYWVRRQRQMVTILIGFMLLMAWLGAANLETLAAYLVMGALGIFLGVLTLRGGSPGWKLAAFTAVAYSLMFASVTLNWASSRENAQIFITARIGDAQALADAGNPAAKPQIEAMQWLLEQWQHVSFGLLFGALLICATLFVVLYERTLRAIQPEGVRVSTAPFLRMRTSEWLIWPTILVAVLWLVDYRWPQEMVRSISWNGAIALTFVYWLNGLAMLLYALKAFATGPFLSFAIIFGVFYLKMLHPALAAFGLFDTWYDFRTRIDRLAAQRRLRQESDGSDR